MASVKAVVFLAQAEADFLRLYAAEEERRPDGGATLSSEVEKALALLQAMPRLGRVVGAPFRRLKLSRFPLSLIYTFEGSRVLVHTIASNHEPMDALLRRLRG